MLSMKAFWDLKTGVKGFEPLMAEPESAALPLGDTPTVNHVP